MDPAIIQLLAVVLGGLIAIAGGIISTTFVERQKQRQESYNLALAFRGEITALVELLRERRYTERIAEVIHQIEQTQEPFYMPMRIRYRYDRVYEENVGRLGLLKPPLSEMIPLFYTRLTSVMEDMVSLGDGTYVDLDLPVLLRIYRDSQRILELTTAEGDRILATIAEQYDLG
jgi:hypothetical protein